MRRQLAGQVGGTAAGRADDQEGGGGRPGDGPRTEPGSRGPVQHLEDGSGGVGPELVDAEAVHHPVTTGPALATTAVRILQPLHQGRGQPVHVVHGHQGTGVGSDGGAHPDAVEGDHRSPHAERLQHREGQGLVAGGLHGQVGGRVPLGHVGLVAHEVDPIGSHGQQLGLVLTVADQEQATPGHPGPHLAPRLEQRLLALLVAEAPGADHQRPGGGFEPQRGSGRGPSRIIGVGEDLGVHAVLGHRIGGVDAGRAPGRRLLLARHQHLGGPSGGEPLPHQRRPLGPSGQQERPRLGAEHRRSTPSQHQPTGQARLGRGQMDEVGIELVDDGPQVAQLTGQRPPGLAIRRPDEPGQPVASDPLVEQTPGWAGDPGVDPLVDLVRGQAGDVHGHAGGGGLGHVEDADGSIGGRHGSRGFGRGGRRRVGGDGQQAPSRRATAPTVASMIRTSARSDRVVTYSTSSAHRCSPERLLRPLTCHSPVRPGRTAK